MYRNNEIKKVVELVVVVTCCNRLDVAVFLVPPAHMAPVDPTQLELLPLLH